VVPAETILNEVTAQPLDTAWLLAEDAAGLDLSFDRTGPPAACTVTAERRTQVEVQCPPDTPRGLLVTSYAHGRGWAAYVDGNEAPIVRANLAQRAVLLGPGAHTVTFTYEVPLLFEGVCLSLLALLAMALFGLRHRQSARAT
jgi:hypothetical protein